MTQTAHGMFTVEITPRPQDPDTEGLGQLQLRKSWTGDVEARGWGLMISGGNPATGLAGYVAMEFVQGSVGGRTGGFALQQYGTMLAGQAQQVYEIVPGSGTDELLGLSGTIDLDLGDGTHRYTLNYDLPPLG